MTHMPKQTSYSMKTLQTVLDRIKASKAKRKVIKDSIQQELDENKSYSKAQEEITAQKNKQALVINAVMESRPKDADELQAIAACIKADNDIVADIALSMYVDGIAFETEDGTKIEPRFKVTLKQPSLF